jgi:hypothetical protein
MPKKKPEKNSVPESAEDKAERLSYEDPDLVPLKLKRAVAAGDLVLHSRGSDTVYRSLKALEKDWKGISDKIIKIVGSSSKEVYERIDSVTFSLGFNAKGKVVFVAEAGIEASISVTFKPNTSPAKPPGS